MKATVYGKPDCEACATVIESLVSYGVDVEKKDAEDMPEKLKEFVQTRQNGALPGVMFGQSMVTAKACLTGDVP